MQLRALTINEKLLNLPGMALNYRHLGAIYRDRNDHSGARSIWKFAADLYRRADLPGEADAVQALIQSLDA